jgi:tRNA 2-thiocytidine biosynthesis protein TtcA
LRRATGEVSSTIPSLREKPGAFRFASRLERNIVRRVGAAIGDFGMIASGDHLLIAVSGGKDSLSLLDLLQLLRRRSPVSFRMTVVTVHQGYASFDTERLEAHYRTRGFVGAGSERGAPAPASCAGELSSPASAPEAYEIVRVPIDQILAAKLAPGTIPCSLCSRIRRGVLYTTARQLGCNKIALGHHLDDLLETLLLNLFFGGQLRSMAPLLHSDDGRNIVIRPLCYVPEDWLRQYSQQKAFPVTTCATEGCGEADTRRQQMKRLIGQLAESSPKVRWHMLRALRNVRVEHLLDPRLPASSTVWAGNGRGRG